MTFVNSQIKTFIPNSKTFQLGELVITLWRKRCGGVCGGEGGKGGERGTERRYERGGKEGGGRDVREGGREKEQD